MSVSQKCSVTQQLRNRVDIILSEKSFLIVFLITCLSLYACGPSKEEMEYREKSALISKTLTDSFPTLTTDTVNGITHNFVREARVKCKVSNVLVAGKQIEDLVKKHLGYVSAGELNSVITGSERIQFKKDSVLNVNHYESTNTFTLKVPNKELDTVLQCISDLAVFIDRRQISANDVKMDLYVNEQARARYGHYKKKLEKQLVSGSGKLNQLVAAEENLLEKQSLSDQAYMASYELVEKVNYSTILVDLYQAPAIEKEVVPVSPTVDPYTPSFTENLSHSFFTGFEMLGLTVLFLIKCWGLILLAVVLVMLYRKTKSIAVKHKTKL